MTRSAVSKSPSGPRRTWTDRISPMGVAVALVGAAVATGVSRATGAGWLPTVGLAFLLGVGLYLWARDEDKGWGDLGEGIMVSVIVAIALMAVQRDADERTRKATERRDRQLHDADVRRERQIREAEATRQHAAERENLQFSLTMQTELRGIALVDRDMHDFFLAGKNFADADLHGANLAGADLRGSHFRRTNLLGANLDKARMRRADLRGAQLSSDLADPDSPQDLHLPSTSLRGADLSEADLRYGTLLDVDFTGAVLTEADLRGTWIPFVGGALTSFRDAVLIFTDFRGARLGATDLRGAKLGGARFCGVRGLHRVKLEGALYDGTTRWPPGFHPMSRGAQRVRGSQARSYKFGGATTGFARRHAPACKR